MFERLRDFLQYKLRDKGIEFSLNGVESLSLKSDPNVLLQILLNLTMNSIEAVGAGGEVEVSCARDRKKVSITLGAVSRKLVETLFGSIDLVPSRRGATFKIALPTLELKRRRAYPFA